jgi:hypothetical protein
LFTNTPHPLSAPDRILLALAPPASYDCIYRASIYYTTP